jgi:hypothetical protein
MLFSNGSIIDLPELAADLQTLYAILPSNIIWHSGIGTTVRPANSSTHTGARYVATKNVCVEDILLLFVFIKVLMSLADELKKYGALLRRQAVGEN